MITSSVGAGPTVTTFAVNKHESHHLTCCVGHGITGVLTVRASCSKGCGESVSAKEVDGELVCNNSLGVNPLIV